MLKVFILSITVFFVSHNCYSVEARQSNMCLGTTYLRPMKGAYLETDADHLKLKVPYLQKSFHLPQESIVFHLVHDKPLYNNLFPEEDHSEFFVVGGKWAMSLYFELLSYYKEHPYEECQILNYQRGVVYAPGVTCLWGSSRYQDDGFTCRFIAFGSGEIANTLIAMPRPRVTSGNVNALLSKLNQYMTDTGSFADLGDTFDPYHLIQ